VNRSANGTDISTQLSEFGVGLNGISDSDRTYLQCVVDYATGNDMEWAVWALQGSYYARDGTINYDESFGLLTNDWVDWRNTEVKSLLGQMWDQIQGP
jgi:endoglucanase